MVTSVSRYTDADRVNTFVQIANIDTFAGRQSNYIRRMADKIDMYTQVDKLDTSAVRTRSIKNGNCLLHDECIKIILTHSTEIYYVVKEKMHSMECILLI